MSEKITFTVVIPYFCNVKTIRDTLFSVSRQTVPPSQLVVVDDQSNETDLLEEICREFNAHLVRNSENMGTAFSRSVGAKLATTSHIALLDADDYWYPNHLEVHRSAWEKCGVNVAAIGTEMLTVKKIDSPVFFEKVQSNPANKLVFPSLLGLALSNPFWNSATTIDLDMLKSVDYWTPSISSFNEDYDLLARFIKSGKKIALNHIITGLYFKQSSSKSNELQSTYFSRIDTSINLITHNRKTNVTKSILTWFSLYFTWLSFIAQLAREEKPYFLFLHPKINRRFIFKLLNKFFINQHVWKSTSFILQKLNFISMSKMLDLLSSRKN